MKKDILKYEDEWIIEEEITLRVWRDSISRIFVNGEENEEGSSPPIYIDDNFDF